MDTFSKRNKVQPNEIILYDAPQNLRIGLCNIIEDYINYLENYENLYLIITRSFQIRREHGINYKEEIDYLVLNKLNWNQVYDLIELIFENIKYRTYEEFIGWYEDPEKSKQIRYEFTIDINKLLDSCGIGWILKKGKLQIQCSELLDESLVQKAKLLLSNKIFEGPNIQFNKALDLLRKRPSPDYENCIKDAIGAVEGTLKILLNDKKIRFGNAIDRLVKEKKIKKPLDNIFNALFAFASQAPAIRHGQPEKPDSSLAEALFYIYTCAACVIYLCELFGYKPSEKKELEEDIPF
ncbi:MAG: hypothetical protein H5U06_09505 [Candidatus Aminicenantes bacterium]|nr:hypothetical protein [Candidatus Aminicenantes bacterium]